MKKYLLIGLVIVIGVGWYYLDQLEKSVRRARSVHARNYLLGTLQTLERTGQFTNAWPELHLYPFTNRFVPGGNNYECVVALIRGMRNRALCSRSQPTRRLS